MDSDATPAEDTSEEVAFLQKSYDDFVARSGADTQAAKAIHKQLEAAKLKIGETAQAKTAKDLAAAHHQLCLQEQTGVPITSIFFCATRTRFRAPWLMIRI